MIFDYEKALSIFPTFFFLVTFFIFSAVYYNRFHNEESDERATVLYRDYVVVMNSQSSLLSVINGLILIILYDELFAGITLLLITQALAIYVFVALYTKSHYDAIFFLSFSVLAYIFEFLFFLFYGLRTDIFGRSMGGLEISLIVFIILIAVISLILSGLSRYYSRIDPEEI